MSRESELAKNTSILAIGTFLPKIASFITLPVLTGCLTKEEYGVYDLIIVLVSLLLPAVTLQIQTAAFRFLIDKKEKQESVRSIVTTIAIFIIPISIITLVISYFCMFKLDPLVRLGICIYFLCDLFVNVTRQVVRGLSQNIKYSISAIISSFLQIILVLVFVWKLREGLIGGILSLALAEALSFVYLFFSSKMHKYIRLSAFSKPLMIEMLKYSWPMVPNSMSMWVMRMSDRLVITAFMGPASNAVYSIANKIPQLLTIAQNTFTMAWQENASIVSKDKDAEGYYTKMHRLMFDLMSGFMGLIIACTPILFKVLVKGSYDEAYIQIPILMMSMFFLSMSAYLGGIYVAFMKTKSVGITTVVAAVINLSVDIALIKFIGLYAASCSTLVSYIFLYFFRLIDVQKIIKLKYNKIHMFGIFSVMVIECGLCMLRNTWVDLMNVGIAGVVFLILNHNFLSIIMKKVSSKIKPSRNVHKVSVSENAPVSLDADKLSVTEKSLPVLFSKKENCCGCTACYASCPVHAITMEPDEEGFLYPVVDPAKCVKCYRCISVCAFKIDQETKGYLIGGGIQNE